jgi:DNA-binding MarR family transcriptional regulator
VDHARTAPESVVYLVVMVRRRLNLLFSAALRPYRLTTRQYGVLARLWRRDGLTVDELAAELYTDQSSLSRVIDRMVRDRLVTRAAHPSDRRARCIKLTAKGRALKRPIRRLADGLDGRSVRGFSAGEIARLQRDLDHLLDNLRERS